MGGAMRSPAAKILPAFLLAAAVAAAFAATRLLGGSGPPPEASRSPAAPAARSPSAPSSPTPKAPHPVSIPALIAKKLDGRDFRVGRVLARNTAFTRYFVTYRSSGLTISGVMNVPRGNGPFPVLILNHGHIDPAVYVNGQGLRPERDYLARNGYVVVHVDYRNHAQSDNDPQNDLRLRLGYTEDVLNAILALRKASLPFIDSERVGMLGRSMGGGVTLNAAVVGPELIDAVVVFSSVSSNTIDNFNKWIRPRRTLAARILAAYGAPEKNPAFWRGVSPVNFFDRVKVPILIHQGTADSTTPLVWSQRTVSALRSQGKDVRYYTYKGEGHQFGAAWSTAMARTVAFFDAILKAR